MSLSATIIIPTYEEAANIPILINEIHKMKEQNALNIDLLFMDDNSQDGSKEVFESIEEKWVHYVIRKTNRGLSLSVIDGFKLATGDVIVVMDADLSHPVDLVPQLIHALENGYDLAIGSRYVDGGSVEDSWGFFRRLNSKVATLLAGPLTKVQDPMTGFFAFKRSLLAKMDPIAPSGYKIGLEMIVKSKPKKICELPIHFKDRKFGKSKLSFKEQLNYIRHLRRLYEYKYPEFSSLIQFLMVGGLGILINLSILTLALSLGFSIYSSLFFGIMISTISNFLLNRRFSFDYAMDGPIYKQFFQFVLASSLGAIINYFIAITILHWYPNIAVQIAALFGIFVGTLVNYLLNRFLVFKKPEKY